MNVLGATLVLALATAEARAGVVELAERPDHVTEARAVIDASPSEVYALVTSYARWPALLSDVRSVRVESGGRENARVQFRSSALRNTVTVVFANDPDREIAFRGVEGPPGGRAHGSYRLIPLDGGKRTQVIATLYLDVVGPPGLFVRDKSLRDMRQAKLRADLEDVAQYFARR